jgi:hypothetical protein
MCSVTERGLVVWHTQRKRRYDTVNESNERPLASPDYERNAHELFPLELTPEEYAARNGHGWMCFSFSSYQFRDKELDAWIQRLGEILFTPGLLDRCRHEILTPAEIEEIEKEMKQSEEDFSDDTAFLPTP